jgi:hypothetical protein
VLATYGRICWLCSHPDANGIDHMVPLSWLLVDPWDITYWRPAHSAMRCPTCGIDCNSRRGDRGEQAPALNTSRQW